MIIWVLTYSVFICLEFAGGRGQSSGKKKKFFFNGKLFQVKGYKMTWELNAMDDSGLFPEQKRTLLGQLVNLE